MKSYTSNTENVIYMSTCIGYINCFNIINSEDKDTYRQTVLLYWMLQFVLLLGASHVKTLLTHVEVKTLQAAVPNN
jgi:hypothetical protein